MIPLRYEGLPKNFTQQSLTAAMNVGLLKKRPVERGLHNSADAIRAGRHDLALLAKTSSILLIFEDGFISRLALEAGTRRAGLVRVPPRG